jgi:transposase
MEGFLSKSERLALRAALRTEKHAKHSDRLKCILLLDAGESIEDIAHYLFLSEQSIRNYLQRYQQGKLERLVSDSYSGSECRLTESELEQLAQHLEEHLYQSVAAIRESVWQQFEEHYTLNGLRHLLRRLGFVYRKPKAVPGKAARSEQEAFLELLEAKLSENPKKSTVYYADGVHPQHNSNLSYGWIRKGQQHEIKTNTGRRRVNINGAVNAKDPTDVIIEEGESVNAQSTVALLRKVEQKHPELQRIYLVVDNARYYRSRLVKEFLKQSKIVILFLPPYSPNLNLIERLWRFLKKIVLHNRYYETYCDFRRAILNFFKNIRQYREQLASLMTLKFHTVGA